jgi:hypothetical protein
MEGKEVVDQLARKWVAALVYITWTSVWYLWQSCRARRHGLDVQRATRLLAVHPLHDENAKSFLSKISTERSIEFLKLNTSQARQITGLLTGHCNLKRHLFKRSITDSPTSGRCHAETATASHIFCEFVGWDELRLRRIGERFREPSDYEEITACKVLYFVRGIEPQAE